MHPNGNNARFPIYPEVGGTVWRGVRYAKMVVFAYRSFNFPLSLAKQPRFANGEPQIACPLAFRAVFAYGNGRRVLLCAASKAS